MYEFIIGNHQNEKKVNVFKVEDLEVYENDFQTQRVKLALSPAL
jgi:hypothetical protein